MRVETKTIVMVALPGVQLLDVSGPLDVFSEANAQAGRNVYRLSIAASEPGPIRSSSGARLLSNWNIEEDLGEPIDTLLIAGCPNAADAPTDRRMVAWLRYRVPAIRRYGSVCSGAFFLARAGLLDGRRITTHWAVADRLAEQFPLVTVEEDAIHVSDGPVRTAAGVTAGLDLALALVEEDLGHDIAIRVASQLVMFFKRPGGQLQFSRKGEAMPAGRAALQEIQRWIASNPALDHSVTSLAKRMDLSPRHFARLFRNEIGITPATWVEEARVNAARRLLEQGNEAPKQVAVHCGFADANTFRRAFARHVGVTPAEYRKRFASIKR
ncbi:GlxA family transcriptional regulator [Rhizobium sp. NPDC090279]|uniref:GlxA family transcriptional regulator n=1 Tax=Rhizobium sp. NPDC090279 TaxID=3364499 RepID=UPI00383B640E